MTNVFDQLLHSESFVDVTLACDGKSIKAHKMVLSACSPYFQSLFFENPCQHPIVILRDVKWSELKSVVEFMYKGEINLAHDEIGPLLNVAEMLKIRGLADVKGDHDAIKLEHSSSMPEIIPVAKQAKHNDWDATKIESLMRSVSTASPSAAIVTATTTSPNPLQQRNARKRNWANVGGSSTITHSSNATVNHINNNSSIRNANKNDSSSGSIATTISNTMDGSDVQSPSSLAEDLPIESSPPSTPPTRNSAINIPDVSALGTGIGLTHADSHSADDMEIKPGIAEMIREEERVSKLR